MSANGRLAKALFFHVSPESVIGSRVGAESTWTHDARATDTDGLLRADLYEAAAAVEFHALSHEEIMAHRDILLGRSLGRETLSPHARLFEPLLAVSDEMLSFVGDKLYCRFESTIAWRDVTLLLGQDMITAAAYAWRDCALCRGRDDFGWPTILPTDNKELALLLPQGLVENHSHLKGASQTFAVTFAYCMNHVESWDIVEGMIEQNLTPRVVYGVPGNPLSWRKRLRMLASLRATLFLRVSDRDSSGVRGVTLHMREYDIERVVDRLRFQHACPMPDVAEPLDYALDHRLQRYAANPFRLCIAERAFLYACFRGAFDGTLDRQECEALYVYLLLKSQFRAEFIQVNDRYGFHNFLRYEGRKDKVFDGDDSYTREQNRIAVQGAFERSVVAMEARLTPGADAEITKSKMTRVTDVCETHAADGRLFFVFHFIKSPDEATRPVLLERNHAARERCQEQAEALIQLFTDDPQTRRLVLGVDAASSELGCRPEAFAPTFGYLRRRVGHLRCDMRPLGMGETVPVPWHVTYHAGEDFLDLADGIRAVDEAIRFLRLRRGDRIGHALAVGVEPQVHARNKSHVSVLPKQELLDNDVWLLRFADEEDVRMDSSLRFKLEREAMGLFDEIYGAVAPHSSFSHYAESWVLREEPPECYASGAHVPRTSLSGDWREVDYEDRCHVKELERMRCDQEIARHYFLYHWDHGVRKRGSKKVVKTLDEGYLALIRDVQDAMMRKMARLGIVVECNPSSNCVIGSFREYKLHPIFRMASMRSKGVAGDRLLVTVNTDDVGVFDTTLENEYALLAAAMVDRADSEETGLDYREFLREMRRNGYLASFSDEVRAAAPL